jgi:hypothetical protein
MRRINISALYYIGFTIHPLNDLTPNTTYEDAWSILYRAKQGLEMFEGADKALNLSVCRRAFARLRESVDTALEHFKETPAEVLSTDDYAALKARVDQFESVSAAELETLTTYAVQQSMAYNTRTLIEAGEEVIHETLRGYLSDIARKDLREAARCLAYQLHTAVGFHILRAVEATIMDFLDLLGVPRPTQPAQRNLGNYITLLKGAGVDARITLPLDQIRALHRNELMHPDRSLDATESSSLFEVSKAAPTAMLIDIKARIEAATATAAASSSPAPPAAP